MRRLILTLAVLCACEPATVAPTPDTDVRGTAGQSTDPISVAGLPIFEMVNQDSIPPNVFAIVVSSGNREFNLPSAELNLGAVVVVQDASLTNRTVSISPMFGDVSYGPLEIEFTSAGASRTLVAIDAPTHGYGWALVASSGD